MNPEFDQLPIFRLSPPRRVLNASTAYFPDYGYKTSGAFVGALKRSIRTYQMPHILFSFGEPENGKEHVVRDIIAELYYKNPNSEDPEKRGKGLIPELEEKHGFPIPIYLLGWGFMFSILKLKGLAPKDKVFGQFTPEEIDRGSQEEESLLKEILRENQGRRALIAVKNPTVAGARFDGELFGVNFGYTVAEKIAKRLNGFNEVEYRDFWSAGKAEVEVEMHGDKTRPELEKIVDKPDEFLQALKDSGETVFLPPEGLTPRVMQELKNMVLYSANPEAVRKFRMASATLAVEMERRGRFLLKQGCFNFDEELKGFIMMNPTDRICSTACVERSLLETDWGIDERVYVGLYRKEANRIIDLSMPIRNPAIEKYPDIVKYRNK